MYRSIQRSLLGLAALTAVLLSASPPASACAMNSANLPPDDRVVQRTEQIDESMKVKMVAVRSDRADNLVIPIVMSYQIVASGEHSAQMLIYDDHPRGASDHALYNSSSTSTFGDPACSAVAGLMVTSDFWNKLADYNGPSYQNSGTIGVSTTNWKMTWARLERPSRT